MKASVIITTYNRPKFLQRAILSCINQVTNYSFEIIIVDDNGENNALQIETASVVAKIDNIRYIVLKKNSGACQARNEGAKIATGDYLFFLDDDDEFLNNKLQLQVNFLENNMTYDGCLAAFRRFDGNGKEIFAASNFAVVGDFKNFVLKGNFFTPMLCIRKVSFLKSGGFIDIPRFQDRFYMMNLLRDNFKFEVLTEKLHIMYEHDENRITSTSLKKTEKAITQIMNWLSSTKQHFEANEWAKIELNSLRQIAMSYYVSDSKYTKFKGAKLYWNIYKKFLIFSDFVMILKCLAK